MPRASDQILTVAEMRAAEQSLIDDGATVTSLMEAAGAGAAEWCWRIAAGQPVTVLCGPGNNGGDGYVIARILRERGIAVTVVAPREPTTLAAQKARGHWGGDVAQSGEGRLLVDCLFGNGLTRPLPIDLARLFAELAQSHAECIAIDLPSGIHGDTGTVLNPDIPRIDLTLAIGAWKPAHWLMPASALMGERRLVSLGVAPVADAPFLLPEPTILPPLANAHKYDRGLAVVFAGLMPGAARLAAEAAAHGGAGYVRVLADTPAQGLSPAIVQQGGLDFSRARAVVVGPGLGRDDSARNRLMASLTSDVPVVADADALWLMAEGLADCPSPAIVTPHEGEFTRLFGPGDGSKLHRARAAAEASGSVVVFKGPDTVIAAPDGRVAVARSASSWLSTAGTGDVLAGLCAARLAVTGDPFGAACEAVWLHAEAARTAGPAFVADDLIGHLPAAIGRCG